MGNNTDLQNDYHEHTSANTGITTKMWMRDNTLHREDGPARIEIDHNENIISEEWYLNGKLGRYDDKPTIIVYEEGIKVEEIWQIDKVKHRESGPAHIITDYDTKEVTHEIWYKNGLRHREAGPAEVSYDNEIITSEYWIVDDQSHREGAPASIHRNAKTGAVEYEGWFVNGKAHRDDGPAISSFFDDYYEEKYEKYKTKDGQSWSMALEALNGGEPYNPEKLIVWHEEWWVDGRLDREDGPAIIIYNKDTRKPYLEKWYSKGKLHRQNKPAWIVHDVNTSQTIEEKSYLKGRKANN